MKRFSTLLAILLALIGWIYYAEADAQGTDTTRPTVLQISSSIIGRPLNAEFTTTITFSEVVTGFEQSDLTLTGTAVATITNWQPRPNGTQYHTTITPTGDGDLKLNIAENVAFDAANNGNKAASRTIQIDLTPPTVTILPVIEDHHRIFYPDLTDEQIRAKGLMYNGDEFKVRIVFSEGLRFRNSFARSELKVTGSANGKITRWARSGPTGPAEYIATILPRSGGNLTFSVRANVVEDKALNSNKDPAEKVTVQIDTKVPVARIRVPSGTQNGPFDVKVTFNEPVAVAERFLTPDNKGRTNLIWYTDGYHGGITTVKWTIDTNRQVYTSTFTPDEDRKRPLKLYLVGDRAFDAAGNTTVEIREPATLVEIDTLRPQVMSASLLPDPPSDGAKVQFTFSEPVSDLGKSEIVVTEESEESDVTIANLEQLSSEKTYVATITGIATLQVTLRIAADAAHDAANNGNKPTTIVVTFSNDSRDSGTVTIDTQVVLRPSAVAQDRIIFNEIRNASDDQNDWIELKNISDEEVSLKDWEVSIVKPPIQQTPQDADIVAFPDYTLPPGGILLIVNTSPSQTELTHGQNIVNPESNPNEAPQYLIASEMILPNAPYLLILRSATDKNGKPEAFEDLAGNYFRRSAGYRTQVWPLINTLRPPNRAALLTQGQAWQRVAVDKPGYTQEAWTLSGHQSGIGYKPDASVHTSLGTPGYPMNAVVNGTRVGRITFSELMFATNGGLFSQPQWIELYNNTPTAALPINLKGWKLVVEARDSEVRHRHSVIELEELHIAPTRSVLLVTRDHRNSGHLSADQVYNLYRYHSDSLKLGLRENKMLSASGFALKLFAPDGTLVDMAGNLDGRKGVDIPIWELPPGRTEDGARTSFIRRYEGRRALAGTEAMNWVRAADTQLSVSQYYGHKTDIATPGYREDGAAPVMLSHFSANRTSTGVVLEWVTASELDNAGFNILRSQTKKGAFVKVNPTLILGAGTTAERRTYTWTDTTPKPDIVYYYRIEEISLSGDPQQSGIVRLRGHVSAGGKRLQKWVDVKVQE